MDQKIDEKNAVASGKKQIQFASAAGVSLILLSLFLTVSVVEVSLRLRNLPHMRYELFGMSMELDRQLLYRVVPHSRSDINGAGYRDREFLEKEPNERRVLIFGDSILMSLNLPLENTIPRFLQTDLGGSYQLFNMGIYGYGPDQELLRLREEGFALKPDLVLLVLFPSNDFNDLYKNRLIYEDPNGMLQWNRKNPLSELLPALRLSLLLRGAISGRYLDKTKEMDLFIQMFQDRYDVDLTLNPSSTTSVTKIKLMQLTLRNWNHDLEKKGIPFGIVIVPSVESIQDHVPLEKAGIPPDRYFTLEKLAAKACADESIPLLDLTGPFLTAHQNDLYDSVDRHLSAAGSRYAASLIKPFLLSTGLRTSGKKAHDDKVVR